MEKIYRDKMQELGYIHLVCDIFINWENVKDEILLPDRKTGSGNGTIHVFLGAADKELKEEFPAYYDAVENGEDPSEHAVRVTHYFMLSNVISMTGYVGQYYYNKNKDFTTSIKTILSNITHFPVEQGMLATTSFFKLSIGSNKLRPYFKQFDSEGVFTKVIRQTLLPNSSYKISLFKNNKGEYAAFWLIGFDCQTEFEGDASSKHLINSIQTKTNDRNSPLQQIFYGAPGTGKSNTIKRFVDDQGKACFRTTFHPDSDYSTFVGAYKPSMENGEKRFRMNLSFEDLAKELGNYYNDSQLGKIGGIQKFCIDYYKFIDGEYMSVNVSKLLELAGVPKAYDVEINKYLKICRLFPKHDERKIIYNFVPQAFTKAYVKAWNTNEDVFLIIEEINRGNCAQIFGDLFQLLDRKDGVSEYPIDADSDLAEYIKSALKDSERIDIPENVKTGQKLMLPANLYIWATMNTSDQSLFPIDSAFKRRWDWTYIPIKSHDEGYRIKIGDAIYDWWGFLEKINQVIGDTTSSEDKKLGYFFVKAENKEVGAEKFVGKVLFYLWNDVFKNYGFDHPIFSRGENKKFAFSDFFRKDGTPETDMVNQFLRKLDEIIDKENSLEKDPAANDDPSSLVVRYNGEYVEGTTAREIYVEVIKRAVEEKGGEQVANCIGVSLTKNPAEGTTRVYKSIGETGWSLATNDGVGQFKKNIRRLHDGLDIDVIVE